LLPLSDIFHMAISMTCKSWRGQGLQVSQVMVWNVGQPVVQLSGAGVATSGALSFSFASHSRHNCCHVCFDRQEAIDVARLALKWELLHVRVQDKCLHWSLRWASRQYNNVLVVIIDSTDKAKFAVPRYRFGEKPKELEKFVRPRLVCTAAVAHGRVTAVHLSDEALNHGSDCFVEVVLRVMTKVWQVSQETGRPMPQHLVIQADNTTSQCKNQVAVLFLALLVSRFKFQTTNLMFLRVGHTHEDVGRGLATCTCWWGMDEIRSIQLAEKCREKGSR